VDNAAVWVVDDDPDLAASLARLLRRSGYPQALAVAPEILEEECRLSRPQCLLMDVMMGAYDGFALAERIKLVNPGTAVIFMTAWPTTAAAVDAVRTRGGLDYLEKPIDEERLIDGIERAVEWSRQRQAAVDRLALLTPREWDVFHLLTRGLSNKMIAAELDIRPKTVEDHRAAIMSKTQASSLAALMDLERALRPQN